MSTRIDISRLRKQHGMSQSELARKLQMNQSFLSAIENGKSPLPPEKEGRLLEIFGLADFSDYTCEVSRIDEHHHHEHHERIDRLEAQLASLYARNDRLMERNEKLALENEALRKEIYELKLRELRIKN